MLPSYKDVIIGERNFRVTYLDARKAVHVQTKLASVIGASLVQALGEIELDGAVKASSLAPLGSALGEVAARLDEKTMDFLIDTLFSRVRFFATSDVSGEGIAVDISLFNGRPDELWQLLWATIAFNFGPFIRGVLARLPKSSKITTSSPSNQAAT